MPRILLAWLGVSVALGGVLGVLAIAGAQGISHTQPQLMFLLSPYLYFYAMRAGAWNFSWTILVASQFFYGLAIGAIVVGIWRTKRRPYTGK